MHSRWTQSAPAEAPAYAAPAYAAPAPAPVLQEHAPAQAPALDPRERPAAEFASLRDRLDALNQ